MKMEFISVFIFVYLVSWDFGCGVVLVAPSPLCSALPRSSLPHLCILFFTLFKIAFEYLIFSFLSFFYSPNSHVAPLTFPACLVNVSIPFFAYVSRLQHYWLTENLEPWESFDLEDVFLPIGE